MSTVDTRRFLHLTQVKSPFQFEQERIAQKPSFVSVLGAGFQVENLIAAGARYAARRDIPVDIDYPGFSSLPADVINEVTEGLPSRFFAQLEKANSMAELQLIAEQGRQLMVSEKVLRDAGFGGFAARMSAAILDPFTLGIGLATGGAFAATTKAATVGRLATQVFTQQNRWRILLASGAISGTTEAGIEFVLGRDNPDRGPADIMVAGLAAAALTTGLGALGGTGSKLVFNAARHTATRLQKMDADDLVRAGQGDLGLTPDAAQAFSDAAASPQARVEKLVDDLGIEGDDAALIHQMADAGDFRGVYAEIADHAPEITPQSRHGMDLETAEEIMRIQKRVRFEASPEQMTPQFQRGREVGLDSGLRKSTREEIANEFGFDSQELKAFDQGVDNARFGDDADVAPANEPTRLPGFSEIGDEPPPAKTANDFDLGGRTTDAPSQGVRISMAGAVAKSGSSRVRRFVNAIAQDAMPKRGDAVQTTAASEFAGRNSAVFLGRANDILINSWREFRKDVPFWKRIQVHEQFLEDVGRAMRGATRRLPNDKWVRQAANEMDDVFGDLGQQARRHHVRGFEKVSRVPGWLPRFYQVRAIETAIERFGSEEVTRLVKTSIVNGYEQDITDEVATKWANAILKIVRNTEDFTDLERSQIFSGERLDLLDTLLRGSDISPDQADQIVDVIRGTVGRQDPAVITPRGQRRARMDEGVELDLNLKDGTGTARLGMADLLENNVHELMELYTRQASGAMAMTEVFREMSREFGEKITNISQIERILRRDMADSGMSPKHIQRDWEKIEVMYKSITGRRLNADSTTSTFLRNARLAQHIRISGQLGIAQIPELGIALGSVGMRAMFQQMPAYADIFATMRTGQTNNQLINELRAWVGLGLGRRNSAILSRFDTAEMLNEAGGGNMELALRRGAQIANDVSFMAPVHVFEQLSMGLMASQRLGNIARAGRKLSKARRKDLGLTVAEADGIFDQIKAKSSFAKGVDGGRLLSLNIDKWNDVASARNMVQALQRWSSTNIQEIDIGNLSKWMTTDLGKVIFQFRPFAAVALEKQLQRRILNMFDPKSIWDTTMEMSLSMLFAGTAYALQQRVNAIGRPDKDEFLERRLTPEAIGSAAFQRAGFTSFFPDAAETTFHLFGGTGSVFDFRNTGLTTGAPISTVEGLTSNPNFDFINKAFSSIRAGTQATFTDESFSQRDAQRFGSLLPYGRVFGVLHAINGLSNFLPEE